MAKLFEIKTGKGSIFSKVFELIQSYIKEINIKITPEGFYISSYDLSKVSITKIDLKKDRFEYFNCEKECIISVNTQIIYKTIKSITKKDTITFYLEENENKLSIVLSDPSGTTKEYKIPLLMIESEFINIENEKFKNFDHIVNLPTARFKSIIKDFDLLDTTMIEIKSFNKQISFSNCDGDALTTITLSELSNEQKKRVTEVLQGEDLKCIRFDKHNNSIIQGKFSLRNLKILIKATNLCEYMNIYLKNDAPIVLEYFAADMGEYKYILNTAN